MLTAEKNRSQSASSTAQVDISEHIAWLGKCYSQLDSNLGVALSQSPLWREKEKLLRSVPGVGPVLSLTLASPTP